MPTTTHCPTCPTGTPNPANFGGMCDPCDAAATQRRVRNATLVAAAGTPLSSEARAIIVVGQRAARTTGAK